MTTGRETSINFFVPGIPKPGGSKTAFYNKKLGRAMVVDACKKNPQWKADIKVFAKQAYSGPILTGPIRLILEFAMPRPKGHYGSGKNADRLKDSAPPWHIIKPDVLKLARTVEDALTGVIWGDDAQIVIEHLRKAYSAEPGVRVIIEEAYG